jgi:para-nitrobenzyl esterase
MKARPLLVLLLLAPLACEPGADPADAQPEKPDGGPVAFSTSVDGATGDAQLPQPVWSQACTDPVLTTSGSLQGLREQESAACVWRGVPYAAPPTGALRWKAPQPAPTWNGVRQADSWGAICVQQGIMDGLNYDPSQQQSEDCLFLNVWRPDKPGTFPVMVWVHGGGYTGGTGNTPIYWGDRLAERGEMVVVTFNYRLGAFGFLADPALRQEDPHQSTGNYGTLDQIAALQWVQDNIARFGGDPNNVTLFGESAGGWSVCTLLASPLAKGLFHRAVLQSGACDVSQDLAAGYVQSAAIAAKVGCTASDLGCLRQVPAATLLKHTGGLAMSLDYRNHHDGHVLTQTPLAAIRAGAFNQVPLVAGHNRDEFTWTTNLIPANVPTLPAIYNTYLKLFVGDPLGLGGQDLSQLYALYPPAAYKYKPIDAISAVISEVALSCPTYLGARAAAQSGSKVWFYRFDYDGAKVNLLLSWYLPMGAGHGMEIAFVFGTTDRKPSSLALEKLPQAELAALSTALMGHWTAFARDGDPGASWTPLSPSAPTARVLDTTSSTEDLDQGSPSFAARCAFWDKVAGGSSVLAKLLGGGS